MNILFLAPRLPLPADTGGKIRTWNILKQVAGFASVHLVCFSFGDQDQALTKEIEALGVAVTLVSGREPSAVDKFWDVLFHPKPYSIKKYYSKKMEKALVTILQTEKIDVVHIDHLHMSQYERCLHGAPRVLDEHNVEYKILERCARVERSPLKKIAYAIQAGKTKYFESRQINSSVTYLAVSDEDLRLLNIFARAPGRGQVMPNGVDTHYFNRAGDNEALKEDAVAFTGSMDWLPNDDAARYFINEILPLIWRERPEVKFYVVGKSPSSELLRATSHESRVTTTGRVDDVRPYLQQSKIFVVPLRIGGGTRLKILEAMAAGIPVVSTSIGAEGIAYTAGKDIVIADEPVEFAQAVLSLLSDQPRREAIATAGRELVLAKYDWGIIGRKLEEIYEGMFKKRDS